MTGALLLTLVVVGIDLLTKGSERAARTVGRAGERLVPRIAPPGSISPISVRRCDDRSVLAVAAVVVIVLLIARRWSDAAFLVRRDRVSVFLITTVLVARPRPTVP